MFVSVVPSGRYWETVERLRISQFYGAPTALRLLLKYGESWVKKYDRSSLRTLGSGWTVLSDFSQNMRSECSGQKYLRTTCQQS